jgi:hypothetical protein
MVSGMTPPAPRRLFVDDRGTGFRVSWHDERDVVVLSVWRDDVCTATVRLPLAEAAELAGFLVAHLGERAVTGSREARRS